MREFVGACRKAGILPGLYVNIGMNMYLNIGADRNSHSVDPGGRFEACGAYGLGRALKPGQLNLTRREYFAVALEMMSELLTDYGDIAELWFDGGVPLEMTEELAELIDARQTTAVSFQGPERTGAGFSGNVVRWSGTETGHTPSSNMWSTIPRGANGVQQMAWGAGQKPGTAADLEFVPAEQDGAIQNHNEGGFWFPGETTKPMAELMKEYEDAVGHNSNYLLELSPDPQGRIPSPDLAAYTAFGHALRACYTGATAARQEMSHQTGLTFELPAASTGPVDRVLIAEGLQRCGQRVTGYTLNALLPGNATWQLVGSDLSVGHCRIQRIAPVPPGTRLRLDVTAVATVSDDESADCGTRAVFLRRMASFDMAGCMASRTNTQPLKSDDHAGSGPPWTMNGRVPMGFYGYNIADPPCTLLRNNSQRPCAPGQPLGPPIGWATNEAFWRAYSSAGFNTFVYEYETRDGFASGLDYLHRQLKLPIFPILGLQNNQEFANACDGKMQAPPNRTAGRVEAAALGQRFAGDHRIFGYETLDEPQGEASWATDLYHTLKSVDPTHPVLLNLGGDGWAAMNITAPLVRAADIATIDSYVDYTKNASDDWQLNDPYNSNTPRVVGRALDYLHTVTEARGGSLRSAARAATHSNDDTPGQVLAVLASLRSNADPTGPWNRTFRYATAREVRAEAFIAVNHGAQGILYWPGVEHQFRNVAPGLWEGLAQVATDMQWLAPMVLAPMWPASRSPVFASATAVDLGVKEANGFLYIIAVNTETQATACVFDVSLLQDRIARSTPVELLLPHEKELPTGQRRNISLDGRHSAAEPSSGSFAFTFNAQVMAPLQVFVYRVKISSVSQGL
eukprot:COSAG05_NODE_1568_length_4532_cov_6.020753_3_plen_853_part_00